MTIVLRVLIVLLVIEATGGAAFADQLDRHATPDLMPLPEYPKAKKRDGRSGIVHFYVRVDETGAAVVSRVSPASSVEFVDMVRAAVSQWRFHPALRSNRYVSEILEFVVLFHPKEGVQIRGPIDAIQERPNK